jgi:hypothetical protein
MANIPPELAGHVFWNYIEQEWELDLLTTSGRNKPYVWADWDSIPKAQRDAIHIKFEKLASKIDALKTREP